jgi:hypothetical protein
MGFGYCLCSIVGDGYKILVMSDTKFGFGAVKANIQRMKTELPIVLANQAQNYFVESWQKQGWEGVGWKEVKRRQEGTPEYKYPKGKDLGRHTRAILVKTGTLRRAVSNSIRSRSFNLIRLVVAVPYAEYLNDGTPKMVARTFMKDSAGLRLIQREKIKEFTDKVWLYGKGS